MEENSIKIEKRRPKNTCPIYMDKELIDKINRWKQQIENHFNGIVKVTYSDICDVVLKNQDEILSFKILKDIELNKFDAVKKLKLLLNRAIELEKSGEEVNFQKIIKENNNILGIKKMSRKKKINSFLEDKGS